MWPYCSRHAIDTGLDAYLNDGPPHQLMPDRSALSRDTPVAYATKIVPVLLLCAATALTGCATYSREECSSGDWNKIGQRDGEDGQPADKFLQHVKACKLDRSEASRTAYLAGRTKGLATFCSPARGYREGALGQPDPGTCPAELTAQFQSGYRLGRRIYEAESRQSDIADALRAASTPQEMQRLAEEEEKVKQELTTLRTLGDTFVRNARKKTNKKN